MGNIMRIFATIIIVQLFYSISVTLIAHSLPTPTVMHIDPFSMDDIDINSLSQEIQDSVEDQINIPVVELGALIFYSGNIILDLLLNFFFAIPQMIGIFINGFSMLFSGIDVVILAQIQAFFSALVTIMYFIGLIQFLASLRSGQAGVV